MNVEYNVLLQAFLAAIAIFAQCIVIVAPLVEEIYTPMKSTFNGLQFCRCEYMYIHSFSRCCLPKVRNPEKFTDNSNL